MLLRDHPLMSCYGIPSWPPTWRLIRGAGPERLTGEVGILTRISVNNIPSTRRCFLYMHHEGAAYIGCIFIADVSFFGQIVKLLEGCLNRPMSEIGSIRTHAYSLDPSRFNMLVRNHPLMSYHGIPSWPPVWTFTDGPEKKHHDEVKSGSSRR